MKRKMLGQISLIIFVAYASMGVESCIDKKEEKKSESAPVSSSNTVSEKYLYVASAGSSATTGCYGGGVTTSGASAANAISRYVLKTGGFDRLVCDWSLYSGDLPISFVRHPLESNKLLVLIENATNGRRIDACNISTGQISTYLTSAGLGGVLRKITASTDGSIYLSDSSSIERFDSSNLRIVGAGTFPNNAFIQTPPGNCATATTNITALLVTPVLKRVLFAHQAASPNNHLGFIESSGYLGNASDCLPTAKIAAPTATSVASHLLLHSSGKLLVSYGSTTGASNAIYAYDFDETNGAAPLSNATQAFLNTGVVNGPSTMIEDTTTGNVYVANVLSTLNTIEEFSFSSTTKTLTRTSNSPYINSQLFTRCISDMLIL